MNMKSFLKNLRNDISYHAKEKTEYKYFKGIMDNRN